MKTEVFKTVLFCGQENFEAILSKKWKTTCYLFLSWVFVPLADRAHKPRKLRAMCVWPPHTLSQRLIVAMFFHPYSKDG